MLIKAQAFGQLKNNPGVRTPLRRRLDDRRAILEMRFPLWSMFEAGGEIRHLEETRSGQDIVAELRRRSHEEIRGNAEFQCLHRFSPAARVRVGHNGIGAKVQKRFHGIGPAFENRGEDIVSRAIAGLGRWAEGLALATDALRRRFLGRKSLPLTSFTGMPGKMTLPPGRSKSPMSA